MLFCLLALEPIDTYSLVGFSYEINFGSLISDILSINPKYAASAKNKSGYFAGAAIPANVPYTASAELREFETTHQKTFLKCL